MATFLLVTILLSIAALAVLVIYLIDRINTLQRLTRLLQPDPSPIIADSQADGPFGGLAGQQLWDALSGVPVDGWDPTAIELIRNRYALVLRKHIEDLFHEGIIHSRAGRQQIPGSTRQVRTLRGSVESWIPVESAMTIYKAGWDRAQAQPEALPFVRKSLDDAVEGLFNTVSIKLPRPMSEHLIPVEAFDPPGLPAADSSVALTGPASSPEAQSSTIALGMDSTIANKHLPQDAKVSGSAPLGLTGGSSESTALPVPVVSNDPATPVAQVSR